MNLFHPTFIAAAGILALSACASAPPAPPPVAGDMVQPAAVPATAPVSAYDTANTGGTYPYGTILAAGQGVGQGEGVGQGTYQEPAQGFLIEPYQQANAETTEGVVVMGPDGTVWLRGGGDNTAYRGDVDSCYAYARGQVDHDVRIESDVASAFDSDTAGLGLTALRGRMNDFERTNRVPALFRSCMAAKGYNRQ